MELAIETGTSPDYWADQDSRTILTALDILKQRNATPGARGLGAGGPISG